MSAEKTVNVSETRQPKLTRAVIRQIGDRDRLEDVARHGADGGFSGFTYYADTVAFFKRNRAEIVARLKEDADSMGSESALAVVKSFRCLQPVDAETEEAIMRCLCGARLNDSANTVANALAWYACEEIARELNPDV